MLIPSLFAAGWGAWALAYRGGEGLAWQGVAIWGSVVAFLATVGHLIVYFSHAMIEEDRRAFPGCRPVSWFFARNTELLALALVVGALLGLSTVTMDRSRKLDPTD